MAGTWNFGFFSDFRKNVRFYFSKTREKNVVWENPVLPGSKIQLLAIHEIISHIWEDGSRKVNNDEPDLRVFHGIFWPVISQAVRKPCFLTSIPRGPNLCILGPPTWARLGPTHVGPAWAHPRLGPPWAHPLEPSLGPPTWAQTPPALEEFSNPDPGPSQRTQGWNTSARKPSLLT